MALRYWESGRRTEAYTVKNTVKFDDRWAVSACGCSPHPAFGHLLPAGGEKGNNSPRLLAAMGLAQVGARRNPEFGNLMNDSGA
ncbi:hypothetical protein AGMMS50256_17020 [Betaproteobacteria bacterium]|nr:hypothetical protein AGMMS50256_17020 [Betaproteobacteria bacterium]